MARGVSSSKMLRSPTFRVLAAIAAAAAVVAAVLAILLGPAGVVPPRPPTGAAAEPAARRDLGIGHPSPESPAPGPAPSGAAAGEVRPRPAGPPLLGITGKVLRPDGEPASGAWIEAALASSEPMRFFGAGPEVAAHSVFSHAGDDGGFVLEGLFPSLYDLTAIHESGRGDLRLRAGASDVAVVLRDGLSIEGTVAFPGGEPARAVEVRAIGAGRPGNEIGDTTNDAGAFRLWPLDPGAVHDLRVTGPTIQDATAEVARAGGPSVEITVEEAILLRGRVLFPDGNPAAQTIGVVVAPAGERERSRGGSSTRRSETDADGRFEIPCPWPGPCRITTEASPPYAPATVEPVDPAAGEVVLRLGAAALLEVTVEDARTGLPLEEAETRVLIPPGDVRVGRGPAPRFALAGAGSATVEARAPGYFAERQEVTLTPRELARLAFALSPAGSLPGIVRAEDGTPVEGAKVTLATAGSPATLIGGELQRAMSSGLFGGPAWTDAGGAFRLSLEKTRAGYDYGFAVEHPDVFLENRVVVEMADPADDVRGVEIAVRRAGRIAGTVRDGDGPVRGAIVLCFVMGAGYHSEASTGLDGRFEIGGLAPGAFTLKVEATGRAPAWIGPIEVAAGATARGEAVLDPEAAIEGRITDPDGRPVAGALVATEWRSGAWKSSARIRSDREGRYRLGSLEPGAHILRVEKSGFTTILRGDVEANGPAADFVLAPLSRVTGRVTDLRSGRPVEKFQVRLLPDRADLEIHDGLPPGVFDVEDGAYRLDGIPVGAYRLIVSAAGYLEHESALQVPPGEAAVRDVALDEGSAILGVVLGTGGEPLEGAEVTSSLDDPAGNTPGRSGRSTTTDAAGRFRLAGLAAGEYRLVVRHAACVDRSVGPLSVRPAHEAAPGEIQVRLERKTRD